MDKIFETTSSLHEIGHKEKVQFLFFTSFWLVLKKNHFWGKIEPQVTILWNFETFMIFTNFLSLSHLTTREATRPYHIYY